jgi:type VI secretion system secreted protein Hcp
MEHYHSMTVEDAIITNITAYMPNCQDPGMAHFTHREDVEFTCRKLPKTHEVASTSESDDWRRSQSA